MKEFTQKMYRHYNNYFTSSETKIRIAKVYGGDILSNMVSAATALFIIRGLSVDDYAVYTAFTAILALIPGLVGSGINLGLVRYSSEHISKTGEKPVELYFISFIFQLALYLLFGVALLVFSDTVNNVLFGQKSFNVALRYGLIAGMGFLISQAGRSVYNAEEKYGNYIKALWIRQALVFLILSLLFLMNRLSFDLVAKIIICVEFGVAGILTVHIFRTVNIHRIIAGIKEQSDVIKEFVSSTGWLIAYFFILNAFQRLDIFMLSHFSSASELANYGVALRYYSLALLALSSIHAVLLPRFSKIDMQDLDKQRQFTFEWLKTTVWIIIPILIFDVFGKSLFVWVNGQQYEKAFSIFKVFSIGIWLSLMVSPLVNILIVQKAFKFLFKLALGGFILSFIGNYLFVPRIGGFGAALTVIITQNIFIQGLILIRVNKKK